MDQMAVSVASPGKALALDTRSLDFELIDMPADYHFAVMHSGNHRNLNEGRYKERKEECDAARLALGNPDICLLSDAELNAAASLGEPVNRRVRHCATEHRRTVAAIEALRTGDIKNFGALMNESHMSMRDDFEISIPSIDKLVQDAQTFGAAGARLTGGGFGGCIVACVKREDLENWTARLLAANPKAYFVC